MKITCWDTRATDLIIKSGQKDTEASILFHFMKLRLLLLSFVQHLFVEGRIIVKDFETVTFYALFVYKLTSVIFC